ncbi:MAG: hypothetical protein M1608_08515 [Candidatus Omnitrophica bacterium]|nr:hypothetical protein [Candidatus Omnitrophota bacterium]
MTVRVMKERDLGKTKYTGIRKWFVAAEKSGEFIGIRYGHLRPEAKEPEWLYYRHTEFDGIGAFAEILRSRGVELAALPQIKYYPAYCPIVAALKHWPRYFSPRHPLKWISLERDPNVPVADCPPPAVAWHAFDEAMTYRIRMDSRNMGVTVNTFLLHTLAKAMRPFFEDQLAPMPWMIPVNMRGGVRQYRDTDNHTSYVAVRVNPDEPIAEVHRKISKTLSRGEHWGNWHAFKTSHCLTHRMRVRLVGKAISQWNIGAFSNLGEWDADKCITHPDLAGAWLFAPPTLRTQMVGTGCVTFQGRLTLTAQAHPELTTSTATVQAWINNWVECIQSSLARFAREFSNVLPEAQAR